MIKLVTYPFYFIRCLRVLLLKVTEKGRTYGTFAPFLFVEWKGDIRIKFMTIGALWIHSANLWSINNLVGGAWLTWFIGYCLIIAVTITRYRIQSWPNQVMALWVSKLILRTRYALLLQTHVYTALSLYCEYIIVSGRVTDTLCVESSVVLATSDSSLASRQHPSSENPTPPPSSAS